MNEKQAAFIALQAGDVIRSRFGEYAVVIDHDRTDRTQIFVHPAELTPVLSVDEDIYKMDCFRFAAEEWHKAGDVSEY